MTEENKLMQLKKSDLVELLGDQTAKINALTEAFENEKKQVARGKLIEKINSFKSKFADKEEYSPDFLNGVAYGLGLAPETPSKAPTEKVNGVEVGGTELPEEMVFTPKGYIKKSEAKGLAIRNDKPDKKVDGVM